MVRVLSAKSKKLKDALSKILDKNIHVAIILKLKISLESKLSANKKENSKQLAKIKFKESNCAKDLNDARKVIGVLKPLKDKRTDLEEKRANELFPCSHCLKAFPTQIGLEKHLRTHTGEKCVTLFKCNQCPKVFPNNSDLKRHLGTHTCEGCTKLFNCNQCFKTFSSYEENNFKFSKLQNHSNTMHKSQIKIFQVF